MLVLAPTGAGGGQDRSEQQRSSTFRSGVAAAASGPSQSRWTEVCFSGWTQVRKGGGAT